ncbi:oxidoreductase (plasmid) [Diaphorobacter sp. HDW4B]|uniref:PDR/VanB family oxidoreductase n=1 Tax=Diaphorobacter sp. HDW4B TaxID=2714925 RepID=UPI0014082D17|nr:PDR/VanB family oxidoreductase [Diaphorobacter sp. HDW4B]QIL74027.1 oxidoreductase [Diaphorobacter sp. HDW4B]
MLKDFIPVRIARAITASETVKSFELASSDGTALPPFTAGTHIDLQLSNGMLRSYSLLNDPAETHRYVIAVRRDDEGRGGSAHIHRTLQAGDEIQISAPRNHFELDETAEHTLLLAGGIGITPLLSMAQRLSTLKKSWQLVYCGRELSQLAFADEARALAKSANAEFLLHLDGGSQAAALDIQSLLGKLPAHAHAYCCGPAGMLTVFREAESSRPAGTLHWEYFAPAIASADTSQAAAGSFEVRLAKSQRQFIVAPDKSILDILLDNGIEPEYGCMEGVCGACRTPVLEGLPDHRDFVLSAQEKAANDCMLLCCSRSLSPSLVLDL